MADPVVKVKNLAKINARIGRMKPAAVAALKGQLEKEAGELVEAQRRAMLAQYESVEDHGHQKVVDSLRYYPNPHRVISFFIIADARDAKGKFIGANIEQGHRAVDGTHVAAQPAFWPTYRARKKGIQRRLGKAGRDALKKAFEGT